MDTDLDRAREAVAQAQHVHFFTGAGMSADSGIATYRDAETGVWENVDPTALASIDSWAVRPEQMWAWYLWRAQLVNRAEPNAGHKAIADFASTRPVTVTTQNIDNLHERGGFTDTVHLHGSLFDFRCCMCARPWRGAVDFPEEPIERLTPPKCPLCKNLIRPGVVWFGEPLPHREWERAEDNMARADVVVIVGTSGVVQPAASLPLIAVHNHAFIIEVTKQPTELSSLSSVVLEGTAATVLPELLHQ